MENTFITITGINHYYGKKPFEIGRIVKLIKEPDNPYDCEAIGVYLPFIDKIGNVANSVNTVYGGTCSSGRIWDKFDDSALARVMFTTHSSVIALLMPDSPETESSDDTVSENSATKNKSVATKPTKEPLSKIGF